MLDSFVSFGALHDGDTPRLPGGNAGKVGGGRLGEQHDAHHDLVLDHMGLAEAIARRYSRGASDPRDVRQVALLGLVKAARRFDPDLGFPFAAFASPTIAGEIKRYLRDTAWLVRPPRSVQELALTTSTAVPELEQRIGHEPSPAEIAEHLSRDVGDVMEAIAGAHGMFATSVDGLVEENIASLTDSADPAEKVDRDLELHAAVRRLPHRDRVILYMRFFEGRNQREIATELGMSQMQVSRALAKALHVVRADLETELPAPQLERTV